MAIPKIQSCHHFRSYDKDLPIAWTSTSLMLRTPAFKNNEKNNRRLHKRKKLRFHDVYSSTETQL